MVFDLFGTLVTYPADSPHVRIMARTLGVEFADLRRAWRRLRPQRDGGQLETRESLRICCEQIGFAPADDLIDRACQEVAAFFHDLLTPRDGAVSCLRRLRENGLRIGLVSDANVEVARAWPGSPLAPLVDVAVFSSEEHVRKPDPALYRAVCGRLAISPAECLYLGNGDGDELAGAIRAGMRAVLYTAPGELPGREVAAWQGPRITDLAGVVVLV